MGSLKTIALAGALLTGMTALASAADLRGPLPMALPPAPIAAPVIEPSGWYLRGDIGVAALDAREFSYSDNPANLAFKGKDFQSQIFGGIGIGYQYNSWLRFDVTGEFRGRSGFSINDHYSNPPADCSQLYARATGYATCRNFGENINRGSVSSMVLLANAYLDLGTWYGLTPFIGGGVGVAQNKVSGISDYGYATNLVTASTDAANVGFSATSAVYGTAGNGTKTNFAWALMAGLGYDVAPNLKLELGYRYLNLGKITTGNYDCASPCAPYSLGAKTLDAHEFRFGMRWMLGGPAYAAAPPPAYPVIKKF